MNKTQDDIAISVQDIHKLFKLPHEQHGGLKQSLVSILTKGVKRGYENQHVLKGISFDINKGDFFGIVGRNGSGKSTLLKLLAGIYTPDKGHIGVNGTIVPFIELGVGFNPELTGRENVFLNGALLGFSRDEMKSMYGDIVEFAELERFMDQKLKNYSSGMQVRLAFSIAIKAQGDILILDEVLAVGDEAFQRKCNQYFDKIRKDKSKTVILVTHSMESVRRYCNKALMVESGSVVISGSPEDVADKYSMQFINNEVQPERAGNKRYGTGKVTYEDISFEYSEKQFILDFDITNNTDEDINSITMGFDFCVDGQIVFGNDTRFLTEYKNGIELFQKKTKHFSLKFDNYFGHHDFTLNLNITTELGTNVSDHIRPAIEFTSNNTKYSPAFKILAYPEVEVKNGA